MQTKEPTKTGFSKLISQRGLNATLSAIFLVSFLIGFVGQRGQPVPEEEASAQAKNPHIERLFGPYRDAVREGQALPILTCIGIVFGVNLLGSLFKTIGGIFIIPALVSVWAVHIGRSVASLHGTTPFSVPAYVAMAGLEWITYVLSASAGANIGLAFAFPRLKAGCASRREAMCQALRQTKKVYLAVGTILAVQAVAEIFYVRAVLLHGGTGVPLQPY